MPEATRLTPLAAAHWPDLASQIGILLERGEGVVRIQWSARDAPTWPSRSVRFAARQLARRAAAVEDVT